MLFCPPLPAQLLCLLQAGMQSLLKQIYARLPVADEMYQLAQYPSSIFWLFAGRCTFSNIVECAASWLQRDAQVLDTPYSACLLPQPRSGQALGTVAAASLHASILLRLAAAMRQKAYLPTGTESEALLMAFVRFLTCLPDSTGPEGDTAACWLRR